MREGQFYSIKMGQRLCLRVDEMRHFGTWPEALWTLDPEYQKMLGSWLSLSLPQLKWLCWSPLLLFAGGRKVVCKLLKILSFPVPGWVLNHKYVFVSWFTCFPLFQLGLQFYLEVPKKPLSSVWNYEEETFRVFSYGSSWKYFEKGVAKYKMIKLRREKSRGGRECNRTLGELERTAWFVYLKSSKTRTSTFLLHNISDLLVFIEGL